MSTQRPSTRRTPARPSRRTLGDVRVLLLSIIVGFGCSFGGSLLLADQISSPSPDRPILLERLEHPGDGAGLDAADPTFKPTFDPSVDPAIRHPDTVDLAELWASRPPPDERAPLPMPPRAEVRIVLSGKLQTIFMTTSS